MRFAGLVLLCGLLACRPPELRVVAESKEAPVRPAATAPAVPLSAALTLDEWVREALENYYDKRAERLGGALEPPELVHELLAKPRSVRLNKDRAPLDAHIVAGEELFEFEFGTDLGLGDAMGGKPPNMHRVHRGAHGGPDTTSCRSCHHRGGDDGAGEYTEAALTGGDGVDPFRSAERNAPMLLGAGALQVLAAEISKKLAEQVTPVAGQEFTRELTVQGVSFGTVRVLSDGSIDGSKLTAIDADLVVRPFGWKGTHSTTRRFAEEAFQVHHGMQSQVLVRKRAAFGPLPVGASPATAGLLRALGDGPPEDPDRDGNGFELEGIYLTSMAVYLDTLPIPVIEPPRAPDLQAAWRGGEAAFRTVGCEGCHKRVWVIESPTLVERGEVQFHQDEITIDLRKDIQRGPKLHTLDTEHYGYPLFLFSDLRRHDMGPELADADHDGPHGQPTRAQGAAERRIPASSFLTRPLWGLADTGPYLHDGRALSIPEAIELHGGEAAPVRERYRQLSEEQKRALHVFLLSLTRAPYPEVVP